uniref:Reverse transcriptase zinc-binding domain-containing protein n=1 Tax=Nelumbo nucifera TaxID=4432 RepID=A0A822ZMW2_NELNU|nr:TPA_asm: hypothetical protein HUJ06_004343 [Nelumbo nucifera]
MDSIVESWKHKVMPPALKMFLWRSTLNILPSIDNLQKDSYSIDDACPLCSTANGTLLRILFLYPVSCSFSEVRDFLYFWWSEDMKSESVDRVYCFQVLLLCGLFGKPGMLNSSMMLPLILI